MLNDYLFTYYVQLAFFFFRCLVRVAGKKKKHSKWILKGGIYQNSVEVVLPTNLGIPPPPLTLVYFNYLTYLFLSFFNFN